MHWLTTRWTWLVTHHPFITGALCLALAVAGHIRARRRGIHYYVHTYLDGVALGLVLAVLGFWAMLAYALHNVEGQVTYTSDFTPWPPIVGACAAIGAGATLRIWRRAHWWQTVLAGWAAWAVAGAMFGLLLHK